VDLVTHFKFRADVEVLARFADRSTKTEILLLKVSDLHLEIRKLQVQVGYQILRVRVMHLLGDLAQFGRDADYRG